MEKAGALRLSTIYGDYWDYITAVSLLSWTEEKYHHIVSYKLAGNVNASW